MDIGKPERRSSVSTLLPHSGDRGFFD